MSEHNVLSGAGEDPVPAAPEGSPRPGPEDLLGLRIAAALIDLAVLAGLVVILSAATGQITTAGTSFHISLDGAWAAVFLAVALLYYFVLEAWAGQTLGKWLLDVRVLYSAGGRPSVWAVGVRTLLRVVDWLPLLYLVGFITMLATGARRQRIGDLAARTQMARAGRPARDRALALLPLALVVLAAVVLGVSRSAPAGGAQTYQGHGVSFDYPAGWLEASPHGGSRAGNLLWTTSVRPGAQHELIVVEGYRLNIAVTAQNIGAYASSMAGLLQRAGATVHGSPQEITMGGLPALQFHATGVTGRSPFQSMIVFAFHGTTEYFVNCQYAPALATGAQQACHQVVSTFHAG